MTADHPHGPMWRLIEKVDGKWTGLITAGMPELDNKQNPSNAKHRVFFSKVPGLAYRDRLRKQGREVRLVEYRPVTPGLQLPAWVNSPCAYSCDCGECYSRSPGDDTPHHCEDRK